MPVMLGRAVPPAGWSGGFVDMPAFSFRSGREAGDVHDLQLDAVGIVKEDGVVPGHVPVLLGAALDLGPLRAQPLRPLVDDRPRVRLEREMVQADAVAVVRAVGFRLRLAQADRAARSPEVPDRLAALALHLARAVPAERAEPLAVEGQAALDRRNDQIDVVDARGAHVLDVARFREAAAVPAKSRGC